jgi:hypothetical protein
MHDAPGIEEEMSIVFTFDFTCFVFSGRGTLGPCHWLEDRNGSTKFHLQLCPWKTNQDRFPTAPSKNGMQPADCLSDQGEQKMHELRYKSFHVQLFG